MSSNYKAANFPLQFILALKWTLPLSIFPNFRCQIKHKIQHKLPSSSTSSSLLFISPFSNKLHLIHPIFFSSWFLLSMFMFNLSPLSLRVTPLLFTLFFGSLCPRSCVRVLEKEVKWVLRHSKSCWRKQEIGVQRGKIHCADKNSGVGWYATAWSVLFSVECVRGAEGVKKGTCEILLFGAF